MYTHVEAHINIYAYIMYIYTKNNNRNHLTNIIILTSPNIY